MSNQIIDRAIEFVRKIFKNDYSGHDYFHTFRVFKTATHIATQEKADLEIVQLAALLHDVDDIKLSPKTHEKKENARKFLIENGIDVNTIEEICEIIGEISFAGKDSVVPKTLEGMCVQDADRLDAIGAIGIARAFAYGGSRNRVMYDPNIKPKTDMTKDEYHAHESTTINHFYEKLFKLTDLMNTSTARSIAERRELFMKDYIAEFLNEWDGMN